MRTTTMKSRISTDGLDIHYCMYAGVMLVRAVAHQPCICSVDGAVGYAKLQSACNRFSVGF